MKVLKLLFIFSLLIFFTQHIYSATKLKAPDFSLEDLEGKTLSLSNYQGNLILFFWATWCPHCRSKVPKLNKLYPEMKAQGIELWAIDVGEPKELVKRFAEKYTMKFPVLLDAQEEIAAQYRLAGVPTFILINKNKEIILREYDLPGNYLNIFSAQE